MAAQGRRRENRNGRRYQPYRRPDPGDEPEPAHPGGSEEDEPLKARHLTPIMDALRSIQLDILRVSRQVAQLERTRGMRAGAQAGPGGVGGGFEDCRLGCGARLRMPWYGYVRNKERHERSQGCVAGRNNPNNNRNNNNRDIDIGEENSNDEEGQDQNEGSVSVKCEDGTRNFICKEYCR